MSKLDQYISKLLGDDAALKEFLVDPIKAAEDDHGLNKAQRSVLRRVVANLSNNATNGYGIVRDLQSYRRSIRLLQNVLHLERAHAVPSIQLLTDAATQEKSADASKGATLPFITVAIYFNGDHSNPQPALENPASAYRYCISFTCFIYDSSDTLQDVMNNAYHLPYKLSNYYTPNDGTGDYVNSFTIPDIPGIPTSAQGKYIVDLPTSTATRDPFWYWSINGKAITPNSTYGTYLYGDYYKNSGSYQGGAGQSFTSLTLGEIQTIYGEQVTSLTWQVIAPDTAYGYMPCHEISVESVFGG